MIELTALEVYKGLYNITDQNNKFELYIFPEPKSCGISYEKVRDEIEKDLEISEIMATDLQDEVMGSIIIEDFREQVSKRMKNDVHMKTLANYKSSVFQDFQSFLRREVDLVEKDIRLVLDENSSSFTTHKLEPGVYTFKNFHEVLLSILQHEHEGAHNAIDIEFDDITMKTKLVVRPKILAIKFHENSFFSTFLGFTPPCDYKNYNEQIGQKIKYLSTINKLHLKCKIIEGSIVDGLRQPTPFSFVFYKPSCYEVLCEPGIILYKKVNKSVLKDISFYSEYDNNEEIKLHRETLTFTIQLIKI